MAPARKRQRTASTTSPTSQDKHEVFTQWSRGKGVEIGSVKPAILRGRGVGLITTAKVKKGERLIFVPEKAMFKPNLDLFGKQKSRYFRQTASPQAQLALSILYESIRDDSPYQEWKRTWPSNRDFQSSMPLFWKTEFRDLLPPAVQQPLQRHIEDYEKDLTFAQAHRPAGFESFDIENEFRYHWAIVNSRSFHFKPPGSRPGYMVLCPFIDYMNHAASGGTVNVKQNAKGYEVIADRDYEPGEEILATYGAHSNDKLLVHYGFINDTSPGERSDDDIRLDSVILPHFPRPITDQLQDVGYLGGYALLPSTNELCFKTQVAVRAVLLTANEWEYFITNGEDMGPDQSERVIEWLKLYLTRYQSSAEERGRLLEDLLRSHKPGSVEAGAILLVKARWTQIREALTAFLEVN